MEGGIRGAANDLPGLFQLLGGYLHRDWTVDYPSWQDAVHAFTAESPPRQHRAALADVDRLLGGAAGEAQIRRVLDEIGLNISLETRGLTAREWLGQLRLELAQGAP
ncbi:MAG: contact-dependent growth inhibition system immunity protein [Candidatus Dormibacteria bacterium]